MALAGTEPGDSLPESSSSISFPAGALAKPNQKPLMQATEMGTEPCGRDGARVCRSTDSPGPE